MCVKTQDVYKENPNFDKVLLKIVKMDKTVKNLLKRFANDYLSKQMGKLL